MYLQAQVSPPELLFTMLRLKRKDAGGDVRKFRLQAQFLPRKKEKRSIFFFWRE
jgi:hypothetical protein